MRYLLFLFFFLFLINFGCKKSSDNPSVYTSNTKANIELSFTISNNGNGFSISPDGNYLLLTYNKFWGNEQIHYDKPVSLYNLKTNKVEKQYYLSDIGNMDEYFCSAFRPDGKEIAAGGEVYNGWFGMGVVIWNYSTGKSNDNRNNIWDIPYLEYSSTGDSLYMLTSKNEIYRWISQGNLSISLKKLD